MGLYIARQPILNSKLETYGYELLFRDTDGSPYNTSIDGSLASKDVIANSFWQVGIEKVTGGRFAFVNFTRELLLEGYAEKLPKDQLVIELLETIEYDDRMVKVCADLSAKGYRLALDDYDGKCRGIERVIQYARIIKADFTLTSQRRLTDLSRVMIPKGIRMLAEKVESVEDFRFGVENGYTLFQGYFFAEPFLMSMSEPSPSVLQKMKMLAEILRSANAIEISGIVSHDADLSNRISHFVNSTGTVISLKMAALFIVCDLADGKPEELIRETVFRARFCELLAIAAGMENIADELFNCGLLSTLDAILDQPLDLVLRELPLPEPVMMALIEKSGPYHEFLVSVRGIERGDISPVAQSQFVNLRSAPYGELYRKALDWADYFGKM